MGHGNLCKYMPLAVQYMPLTRKSHLPYKAVGSGQHPLGVNHDPSTDMGATSPQADLPWPIPGGGVLSTNNAVRCHRLTTTYAEPETVITILPGYAWWASFVWGVSVN